MNIDDATRQMYFEKLRTAIDFCNRILENDTSFDIESLLIRVRDNLIWVYEDLDIYR